MQNKIIILIILFLLSCNKLPESTGDFNEINIFLSDQDKPLIKADFDNLFNEIVHTPIEESKYKIIFHDVKYFFDNRYKRNIIVTSLDNPPDSTADYLFSKFSANVDDKKIFILDDYYALNQKILFINSVNNVDMNLSILDNTDWILDNINSSINYFVYNNYIKLNEPNNVIIEEIKKYYDLNIFVDENYKIIKNENKFLWIGRGYPYRWLIFSEIKLQGHEDLWNLNKENLELNIQSVKISDYYKEIITKDDRIILSGLYEHIDSDTGGPFFTYVFDYGHDNKVNLISGFVNNPGKDKFYLLKELELIIKNINIRNKNEK